MSEDESRSEGPAGPEATTRPDHPDSRLRGRRYAIPFERVWSAAVDLVERNRRWNLAEADDRTGVIRAEAKTLVLRFVDDVTIRVSLDRDAQTRVDLTSTSRKGRLDFGTNARRIRRYLRRLDRAVDARPAVTLPPEEGVTSPR